MSGAGRAAWSAFWEQEQRGGGSGCLPQGWAGIDQAQQRVWREVARGLPRAARVLDLATGDARVLRWLQVARLDLKPTGIDAAPTLPPAPKGCKVRAGVAMEKLPFADGSFDLVTSQFGFEYGETVPAAREIGRVLKPGGAAALMVHRGDGPILAHNLRRRDALRWALDERDIIGVARQALMLGAAGQLIAGRLGVIAEEGARQFGNQSPAWELPEAARRSVLLALQRDPASLASILTVLEERARAEMARIASLERACGVADDRERLLRVLGEAGLDEQMTKVVGEPGGRIFADLIRLRRR